MEFLFLNIEEYLVVQCQVRQTQKGGRKYPHLLIRVVDPD
jgi:hypothetical protein